MMHRHTLEDGTPVTVYLSREKHGHCLIPDMIRWAHDNSTGAETIEFMHAFRRVCNRHN